MNSAEAKKFNPANIAPERFLRSATEEITGTEAQYVAGQVEKSLVGGGVFKKRKDLRLGSEFEVLYFSARVDPVVAVQRYPSKNPNYQKSHGGKIDKILNESQKFASDNPDLFWKENPVDEIGRIMLEYRLAPLRLGEYLDAVNRFREHVVKVGKKFGVLPVVFSQHLHVSLLEGSRSVIKEIRNDSHRASKYKKNLVEVFKAAAPFVQLPEEFDVSAHPYVHIDWRNMPPHEEFRLLSSEYGCDPGMNALLTLMAVQSGVSQKDITPHPRNFSDDFEQEAADVTNRAILVDFMGQSLVSTLSQIVSQYPDISRRRLTVPELVAQY